MFLFINNLSFHRWIYTSCAGCVSLEQKSRWIGKRHYFFQFELSFFLWPVMVPVTLFATVAAVAPAWGIVVEHFMHVGLQVLRWLELLKVSIAIVHIQFRLPFWVISKFVYSIVPNSLQLSPGLATPNSLLKVTMWARVVGMGREILAQVVIRLNRGKCRQGWAYQVLSLLLA